MQRVTPGIGMAFQTVEDNLRDTFLPALFHGATSQIPRRAITGLLVKQARIILPESNNTSGDNRIASCVITGHLATALRRTADFSFGDHALLMG